MGQCLFSYPHYTCALMLEDMWTVCVLELESQDPSYKKNIWNTFTFELPRPEVHKGSVFVKHITFIMRTHQTTFTLDSSGNIRKVVIWG